MSSRFEGQNKPCRLVALGPTWNSEVVLVINMFDTFDQPLGELLLRDGFALVSSAIGNEELSFVVAPDVISTSLQISGRYALGVFETFDPSLKHKV